MLSERIKKIIDLAHITQSEFAQAVGMPVVRVRNLVQGNIKKLQPHEIKTIRDTYDIRDLWLVSGGGPMYVPEQEKAALPFMDALARATAEVAPLDGPDSVKRIAQEWLFAVYRADSARLAELAALNAAPGQGAESLAFAVLDEALLQDVIGKTLEQIERNGGQMRPAKLAAVLVSAYQASAAKSQVDVRAIERLVKIAT